MVHSYGKFMGIALQEAKRGFNRGDFPVGAVLAQGDILIGTANNSNHLNENWSQHAEAKVIRENAYAIKRIISEDKREINLYTTLEPCLMCYGTGVLNRINRIIYACPDPNGGALSLDFNSIPPWYRERKPSVTYLKEFYEESYDLLEKHMSAIESWKNTLEKFREMDSYMRSNPK